MVAQITLPRRAAKVRKVPARHVRDLLLELTYRLHATKVVKRLHSRSTTGQGVTRKLGANSPERSSPW